MVASDLLELGKKYGLEADDLKSTPMGCSGVDVLFSPQARRVLGNILVECKNRESLNVVTTFWEHSAKYPDGPLCRESLLLLVHSKNKSEPLVTLRWSDFRNLLREYLNAKKASKESPVAVVTDATGL
jgi:hypothetical protein